MEYTKQIDHFENTENIYVGDLQICRCAAHTAQLCALDVTKQTIVKDFLFQCRNLTKYIRKPSNGFREVFELRQLKLPQLDCPTRWGSTFNMIDDLNKSKSLLSLIETVENKTEDENFEANDFLWDFIDCYVTVMAPLQKTIVQFQEEQLHYGNFYALWLTCKLATNHILSTNAFNKDSIIYIIGNKLIQSMETRSKKLVSNVGFDACLYLNPRFHHIIDCSQKERAINFLKTLWDQLKIHGHIPNFNNSGSSMDTDFGQFKDNNFELLDNFLGASMVLPNESTDVYGKIETLKLPFMKSNVNVLNFWKDKKGSDPELYALSKVCFAIPPTQVTIERAFSSLKLVLSDNRNRLSHETLENILLVKLNPTHLDSAIDNLSLFENDN